MRSLQLQSPAGRSLFSCLRRMLANLSASVTSVTSRKFHPVAERKLMSLVAVGTVSWSVRKIREPYEHNVVFRIVIPIATTFHEDYSPPRSYGVPRRGESAGQPSLVQPQTALLARA